VNQHGLTPYILAMQQLQHGDDRWLEKASQTTKKEKKIHLYHSQCSLLSATPEYLHV